MRKIMLTAASAIALLGLAGCGDGDENPTQSSQPATDTTQQQPASGTPEAAGTSGAATNGAATEAVQTRPSSSTGGPAPGGATGD